MAFALVVLAVGSVVAGWASVGGRFEHFLEPSFAPQVANAAAEGGLEVTLMVVSSIVALVGIGLSMLFFLTRRGAADAVAERFGGLHRVLMNKYYVDEIYDAMIVEPIRIVSEDGLWKVVDTRIIDGAVNAAGETVAGLSEVLRRLQTGSVRAYAGSLLFGVVLILGYYLWR